MILGHFIHLLPFLTLVLGSCKLGNHINGESKAKASDNANYHELCIEALRNQVHKEFEASLQYLLMGAYFSQDDVNLNAIADRFYDHADEERQHGLKFIEYLRMRGDTSLDFLNNQDIMPILGKTTWEDATEAFKDALIMEKSVTGSIKGIIDVCDQDDNKDYHAGDWLTGTWLDEQLIGQREIAGIINSLSNFRKNHEDLADWMFNNQLLNNK